jgi:hypothetical protein
VNYTDPTGHYCVDEDKNGNSIRVDCETSENQKSINLRKKLEKYKKPKQAEENEMINFFGANLSPAEYDLLKNDKGNVRYTLGYQMYQIQQDAFDATKNIFGVNGWNDPADAFRHAYWNALLTKEFGLEFAGAFTKAHETGYVDYDNTGEVFMDYTTMKSAG